MIYRRFCLIKIITTREMSPALAGEHASSSEHRIKAFLKRHNLVPCKEIHETKKYYRQRLIQPNYKKFKYRFYNIKTGLDAILQFPR